MPAVRVEVDLAGGWSTLHANRFWTDITEYVLPSRGISITHGRGAGDPLEIANENTLSLVLDNRDGRFTAGYAQGAYYPAIKVGLPIRVVAKPYGQAEVVRFTGYVDSWPVEWDGTDASATAPIVAVSRLARMGRDAALGDFVTDSYLEDAPWALYPLSGRRDVTDQRGKLGFVGDGDKPTFDVEPGIRYSGRRAAEFSQGRALWKSSGALPSGDLTAEIAVRCDSEDRGTMFAFYTGTDPAADPVYYCRIKPNGHVEIGAETTSPPSAWTLESTDSIADGLWHHVAVVYTGAETWLYIDGAFDVSTTDQFRFGTGFAIGGPNEDKNPVYTDRAITADMAFFAIHDADLSSARVLAHGTLITGLQDGETTAERIANIAAFGGVDAGEQDIDAGATLAVSGQTFGQDNALAMLRVVEATEGGVLYDGRDGSLVYKALASRFAATEGFIFDMAAQEVRDWRPTVDRSVLMNIVTVRNQELDFYGRAEDQASIDTYGPHARDLATLHATRSAAATRATFLVDSYAEPSVRVPEVEVEVVAFEPPDQAQVLALDVSDLVRVTNLPRQAGEQSTDFFVEGYTETISAHSWQLTLNVSPAAPFQS